MEALTLLARQGVVMTPPRNRTLPDLSEAGPFQGQQLGPGLRPPEDTKSPFGRCAGGTPAVAFSLGREERPE